MKKIALFLCAVCACTVLGLTACGRDYAKIVGIKAGVVPYGVNDIHNGDLCDEDTLADNDYVLETQNEYELLVYYIATGGSRYPVIHAENVNLKYDAQLFEVTHAEETAVGDYVRYRLICKAEAVLSAILIEVGEHFDTVIISANQSA